MTGPTISDEQTVAILEILMLGVTPAISICGVIGNVFSIVVLVKHGLHRCSNILLVCLAFNDISFLIGFNSVPKFLYELSRDNEGFAYNLEECYILFGFYQIFTIMDYGCGAVSLTLPVLITAERLIAVFLPMRFSRIVTTRRTWCAALCISVFWYGYFTNMAFFLMLDFKDVDNNMTLGVMTRSDYHNQNPMAVDVLETFMSYTILKIPPILTLTGCVVIGVRIRIAASQRHKLTSRKGELSNRTTKMLMAVCFVYTIACGTMSLPTFIPQYMYYSISSDAPSNLGRILYQVMNTVLCINSSCNFIIYVVMNKNFRNIYCALFKSKNIKNYMAIDL